MLATRLIRSAAQLLSMPLKITDAAAAVRCASSLCNTLKKHFSIQRVLEVNKSKGYAPQRGLFVAVVSGGCAGFAYRLEMAERSAIHDPHMYAP